MDYLIKPKMLHVGDCIGLFSPAAPHAGLYKERYMRSKIALNQLGLDTFTAPHALLMTGQTAGSPEQRAQDLNSLIENEKIDAVMAMIGGNHSHQLLPLIDYKRIQKSQKVIIGYSDMTILLIAIYKKTGLITFYGPAAISEFGEFPKPYEYTCHYFKKILFHDHIIGNLRPAEYWTDEFVPWEKGMLVSRKLRANKGWNWLKAGYGEGILIGGCLESLLKLVNTTYWPDLNNAIIFIEIAAANPSMKYVKALIKKLIQSCNIKNINGLMIGRYNRTNLELEKKINNYILEEMRAFQFPIVANIDFGHTDPKITLPIGSLSKIDSSNELIYINTSAVKNK